MTKKILSISFLLVNILFLNGQASLSGVVKSAATGEPVLFSNVILLEDGEMIWGAQTGFEGEFRMVPIEAGVYELVVANFEYDTLNVHDIHIIENEETFLDLKLNLLETHREIPDSLLFGRVNEEDTLIIRGSAAGGVNPSYYVPSIHPNESQPVLLLYYSDGRQELDCFRKLKRVRLTDPDGQVVRRWMRLKAGKTKVNFEGYTPAGYYLTGYDKGKEVSTILWIR